MDADHEHHNHHNHQHHARQFRNYFAVSLLLTIPALVWEPMIQNWFGYQAPDIPGAAYIPLTI